MIGLVARARRTRGDEGAYAVLYAVVIVVILAMAALVIDVTMVRNDRRTNRSASDAAAIIGARTLGYGGTSPIPACQAAMAYAETALNATGSDDCLNAFAGVPATLCTAAKATGIPLNAFMAIAGRTVNVIWPVLDSSTFINSPDLENWGVNTAQPAQAVDGDACARLGVAINDSTSTLFGTGLGFGGSQGTQSRSVGLAVQDFDNGEVPAPLVVLDPTACAALAVSGGGTVLVKATADFKFPGAIQVDSDGSGCTGNGTYVITTGPNSHIWALDTPTGDPATIREYAILTNPDHKYAPTALGTCTNQSTEAGMTAGGWQLCPKPIASGPISWTPWKNRYNCAGNSPDGTPPPTASTSTTGSTCPQNVPGVTLPTPRDYVDQWYRYAKFTAPTLGTTPTHEVILPNNKGKCDIGDRIFPVEVFANCDLSISGKAVFQKGLVVNGSVSVAGSDACIVFNDVASQCTGPVVPADSARGVDGANVFIAGDLSVTTKADIVSTQTFMYVDGQFDINLSTATKPTEGNVYISAPYGRGLPVAVRDPCTGSTSNAVAPKPACFEALAMWAPAFAPQSKPFNLKGQTFLKIDGTLFTPKAYFFFTGGTVDVQDRAQFVARILDITGSGQLTMIPNTDRSTLIPGTKSTLIR